MTQTTFSAEVFQNPYLPEQGEEVHAIMTVTSSGEAVEHPGPASEAPLLFGLICDVSGSMGGAKILAARQAMTQAIELLPPRASFFVILGSDDGKVLVPTTPASEAGKASAIAHIRTITAQGGTVISSWLAASQQEFTKQPQAIAQALLLTDGQNDSSDEAALAQVLKQCEGQFQCHCRGVGTGWHVKELKAIATALLGSTDIIPEPAQMVADFQAILGQAARQTIREIKLRLWTPSSTEVVYCKQVSPEIVDLTDKALSLTPQSRDYPTGAWSSCESRDYHFCLRVQPGKVGDEMLAGRASLVSIEDGVETKIAEAKVLAIWTDDEARSTKIDRHVANATGQAELADSIQQGLEARERGNLEAATAKLGRAVQLAQASGNEATAKLLRQIVEVEDAASGTVKLRRDIAKADAMALETRSTKTQRIQPTSPGKS